MTRGQGGRRRLARVPGLLALAPLVALGGAACGGDDGSGDDGAGGSITVEHAQGSTTVEQAPERIVTLGVQWTDVLLAMDVQPVGYLVDESSGETGPYPWQEDRLDGATEIVMTGAVPYEQIAELEPDLILATHVAEDAAVYDTLSQIAPTVGLLGERQVDAWQDLTDVAGQLLDQPERAEQVVTEVDELVAEAAGALPALEGKTFSLVNYVPGDSLYVVADPEDGSTVFFEQLGMGLNPDLLAQAEGVSGRLELSFERVDMLSSDLLVLLTNDGDPDDLPGYAELPAVRSGSVAQLELQEVVGLNTPTPLSIPFVLDLLRPTLQTVAS